MRAVIVAWPVALCLQIGVVSWRVMATTVLEPVSVKTVHRLMHPAAGRGTVLSCYAGAAIDGPRAPWRTEFVRELHELEARMGSDDASRHELASNVSAILAVLGSRAIQRGKGLAVFASATRGLVQSFVLHAPPPTRLVVGDRPYVVPLLRSLHQHRPYLVVHADLAHARLHTAGRGPLQFICEVIHFVVRPRSVPGDGRGRRVVTNVPRATDRQQQFRKSLVREIARIWMEERYNGLILLGAPEALALLGQALPASLADAVVHTGPLAFVGGVRRLQRVVDGIVDRVSTQDEARMLDRLRFVVPADRAVLMGSTAVLSAIRAGEVNWSGCIVTTREPEPADRSTWEELTLLAAERDLPVYFVEPEAGLARHGGVIALRTGCGRGDGRAAQADARRTASDGQAGFLDVRSTTSA